MAKAGFGNAKNYGKSKRKASVGGAFAFWKGASVKRVKMDDLSSNDIIIAVMGPTGSGKSTFINTITGLETGVGFDLESCTSEIITVRLAVPELTYGDLIFVDTPGFDDTNKSDVEILKMIANWLKSTYAKEILLSGLLYFHRISDNRMAGAPLRNLRVFEELCGRNALQRVILVTTMWDEIEEEDGETRERELKSKYWKPMLRHGSTTSRFMRTRESAFALVDPFIDAANRRISLLLQQEMVDMSRELPATCAGSELYSKMKLLVNDRQELLDRVRGEIKRADGDEIALRTLQQEHEKLRINLEETVNKMRELKLPLGKRLVKIAEKFLGIEFTSTHFNFMLSSDSSPDDVIIAVIGPSGSGKSTFINTITGLETGVGHQLESCTREVRGFRRFIPELAYDNLVFVDTPGFDDSDTEKPDVVLEALKTKVAEWLESKYGKFGKQTSLSGILYFHRISDNRMTGTPLRMLKKLCGQDAFQNVVLATTMWDEIAKEEGEKQEQELKSIYWKPMLDHGSTTSRFLRSRESALALVDLIIEAANKGRNVDK